jgi:phosphotransferase system HPr (HPr) family protein
VRRPHNNDDPIKEPSMCDTQLRDRRQVIIIDPLGLYLRPAAKLVVLAKSFRSDIHIIARGTTADGKSLLDLVALGAECGTTLDFVAHGPDAEEAVAALADLIGGAVDGSVGRRVAAA